MSIAVEINDVDRSNDIDQQSLTYDQRTTDEPAVVTFFIRNKKDDLPDIGDTIELHDYSKNYVFQNGNNFVFQDGTNYLFNFDEDYFKGTIIERNEEVLGNRLLGYRYVCMDGRYSLDGQLVIKAYNDTNAVAVVQDIIDNFTTGFTLNAASGSPSVESIRFNYEEPSRAIEKIAKQIGWEWYVDSDDVVQFFPPDERTAEFGITDDNGKLEWNSLKFNRNITELKNVVYVRGGEYKDEISEDDAVDKYEADGEQDTFPLVYRYENVQVIKDGVAQGVGTDFINVLIGDQRSSGTTTGTTTDKLVDSGATFQTDGVEVGDQVYNSTDDTYALVTAVDSETQLTLNKDIMESGEAYFVNEVLKDCLYNFQEKSVRFPKGALVQGDVVRVFGDALIPLIVQAEDTDSIVTYGRREYAEIDKSITSIEEAELLADGIIDRWREGNKEGSFQTRETSLRVGQTITINSTIFGVDTTYRINRIQGRMNGRDEFIFTVEFLKSGQVTFNDIMVGLLGRDKRNVTISPDEVVQRLRTVTDSFGFSDEIVDTETDSAPYHWGPVTVGNEGKWNFFTWT